MEGLFVVCGASSGPLVGPVAGAVRGHLTVVDQLVQERLGDHGVGEERIPVLLGARLLVRIDDRPVRSETSS
jgi:hypothetical protein